MCLLIRPNSVYYTCIVTPLSLRVRGYPNEFKFSLLTRERKTAYLRNIEQVQLLHALFDQAIDSVQNVVDFKVQLASAINALRLAYKNQTDTQRHAEQTHAPMLGVARKKPPSRRKLRNSIDLKTLNEFIESKSLENVTQLTLKQLSQRCGDFLAYMKSQRADKPSNSLAMNYRDELLKRELSHKTIKDYIAANEQFFNWCVARELLVSW